MFTDINDIKIPHQAFGSVPSTSVAPPPLPLNLIPPPLHRRRQQGLGVDGHGVCMQLTVLVLIEAVTVTTIWLRL